MLENKKTSKYSLTILIIICVIIGFKINDLSHFDYQTIDTSQIDYKAQIQPNFNDKGLLNTYTPVDICGLDSVLCKYKEVVATVYGYSSEESQTDDTPNITASGQKTRYGIIANNCLEFGTKIKIDDEIFEVQDRMNKRYGCEYFDIFFWSEDEAKQWGRRTIKIEIHN